MADEAMVNTVPYADKVALMVGKVIGKVVLIADKVMCKGLL